METIAYWTIAALLVAVGLAGTVLPALPGIVLVFGGLFIGAWIDGFARVGPIGLAIIAVLGALAFVADFAGSVLGAKRAGASRKALAGAALGGALGLFFGIPGLLVGPFAGAVLGELWARGGFGQATRVGIATWLGLFLAAVAKVALACLMVATFAAFYFASR